MILMNDFKKEYKYFQKEIDKAVKSSLQSGWYILGEKVANFEKEFSKFIGAKYTIGVANGLEALQISLMAIGVKAGDEVITVSNTAVATALAITNIGAKPVFVDVDEYHHLDPVQIEKSITKKTKAIIPVHLFGQPVEISKILKVAKKHNLAVIEDACQAHGAKYKNKSVGTFGDLAAFSFYPTKNLGGYGDGGAITTNSKKLFELCMRLRNYGQETRYIHKEKGLNSRLDEIQAAILSVKLKKLKSLVAARQRIANAYIKNLKDIKQIKLPNIRTNSKHHAFHLFVIEAQNRDALQAHLKEKGIQTLIHYPTPIHKQECFKEDNNLSLPNTEKLANTILSLPIHPFMTKQEVDKVCFEIKNFYNYKQKPTVSVAVSALNEEANLGPYLKSVLSQKHTNHKLEKILIISDGSTDNTVKVAKSFKSKVIEIRDYKERVGKSVRLNEIYKDINSDILILADADVILVHNQVIKELVEKLMENDNVALSGGHPIPLPATTFTERAVNITLEVYIPLRKMLKNGNNILSATGRAMAMKRKLYKNITVPKDTIANDGFSYFCCITQGYDYRYAPNAVVYFRSPTSLRDHLSQNTRFSATTSWMSNYFPRSLVENEYHIPRLLLWYCMVRMLIKHPVLSTFIWVINRYCHIRAWFLKKKINALWDVVYTTKKLRAV